MTQYKNSTKNCNITSKKNFFHFFKIIAIFLQKWRTMMKKKLKNPTFPSMRRVFPEFCCRILGISFPNSKRMSRVHVHNFLDIFFITLFYPFLGFYRGWSNKFAYPRNFFFRISKLSPLFFTRPDIANAIYSFFCSFTSSEGRNYFYTAEKRSNLKFMYFTCFCLFIFPLLLSSLLLLLFEIKSF